MAESTKDYLIGTNQHASSRLNLQHYWATLTCGYLLHPDIPVPEDARIADIATGTGIWPISLSLALPASVQLNGFDITDAQFPPREWLPPNVRLEKLDILGPVPQELRGRYDVVAIRFFSLMVMDNDVSILLGNLLSLLKPGGYLQWIEPDISASRAISPRPDICSEAAEALMRDAAQFLKDFNISYDWLHALPTTCKNLGMVNVAQYNPPTIEAIRPIFAYGTVGAYEEFSYSILDKYGPTPSLGSGDDLRKRLEVVRGELENGVAFEQPLYVLVAQRPGLSIMSG
ncbi:hypothetical protein ASPCAL09588 [Aspergillus calidoustus]|uniref:Methyltransferase domain-containing protein n=1 Tax=Aspergillus calidoustus TaxID=454130 RepID=A0A0U5CS33_ASPCI|nr:hypothetical protein ASPCAL09588 [Aspergillus calidoustus]